MEIIHLPQEIQAKRIKLCKHRVEDASIIFRVVNKERKRLTKFLPWVDYIKEEADQVKYIEKCQKLWNLEELFDFSLKLQETDEFMGCLGVHTIDKKNDCAELGYWISEKFEGKGYIQEGISALEKILFQAGFYRLEIRCNVLNERSFHVAERLGYQYEGTLRGNLWENNQRRNTKIYSKLSSD